MMDIWHGLIKEAKVPRVITIIGGGGKTSLMYYLLRMLKASGYIAVATTTTKLSNQQVRGNQFIQISSVTAGYNAIQQAENMQDCVTLVSAEDQALGKMIGISGEWIDQLAARCDDIVFVVEADGSAGKSLKGHLRDEPVIPSSSSLVIPVIGIDCVGRKLEAQHVHRLERICELTGAARGSLVTTELVTQLLFHPQGYLHNCLAHHIVVPFINKAETIIQRQQAKALAEKILTCQYPQLSGVMIGSVLHEEGVWLQV